MQLFDELRREHELIETVLGSLRTWADRRATGDADPADGLRFIEFFTLYAGEFHHEREEEILFPALAEASLPVDRGPVRVILDDHRTLAAILAEIRALVESPVLDDSGAAALRDAAKRYSHELWAHIDAENSVLFPESEIRLRRNGVRELPTRPPTGPEERAGQIGEELVRLYPPISEDIARGEGCALCPAYGERCEGLEREWWNEWEWNEMDDHIASS
jgi:hemerythrin-like domain-containing protein